MKNDEPLDDEDALLFDFDHEHPWYRALARELARAMRKPVCKSMRRLERDWPEFAAATMDFVLDVVDSPSLWGGYEAWNLRQFGVALPITEGDPGTGLSPARLRHFVWKLVDFFAQDFSLHPDHPDARTILDVIGSFWEKRKGKFIPLSDSSSFLAEPIRRGWQAKDRLLVLGRSSYFFRNQFDYYVAPYNTSEEAAIRASDDFLCQSCSQWSGMGPIDLLAEVVDAPDALREDIRSWSERHAAPYRIDAVETGLMRVTNLVTNEQYRVHRDEGTPPIPVGVIVFGFLARWDGAWRWSGAQTYLGEGKSGMERVVEFIQGMRKSSSAILCRYWPEYRRQVLETMGELYRSELEYYGGRDLVYFETGRELAVSNSRFLNEYRDKRLRALETPPSDIPADFTPETVLNDDIRECDEGVMLFLNPDEGGEMMLKYDHLASALRKEGEDLADHEREAMRGFIQSQALSPAFVKRVLRDESDRSLRVEFGVGDDAPAYWLDWVLHCWKGEFYRPRYPSVSVV